MNNQHDQFCILAFHKDFFNFMQKRQVFTNSDPVTDACCCLQSGKANLLSELITSFSCPNPLCVLPVFSHFCFHSYLQRRWRVKVLFLVKQTYLNCIQRRFRRNLLMFSTKARFYSLFACMLWRIVSLSNVPIIKSFLLIFLKYKTSQLSSLI